MLNEFKEWLETILVGKYQMTFGLWNEDESTREAFFCSVRMSGGAPDVDDRSVNFELILVGPRDTREASLDIREDAERIMLFAIAESRTVPCGAANIRALREPVGPGYTNENRAWFSLSLEVIF